MGTGEVATVSENPWASVLNWLSAPPNGLPRSGSMIMIYGLDGRTRPPDGIVHGSEACEPRGCREVGGLKIPSEPVAVEELEIRSSVDAHHGWMHVMAGS